MDATSHFYLARSNQTLCGAEGTCLEIHYVTDAEWEFNWDTGGTTLRILDTEPSRCVLPACSPTDLAGIIAARHGECNDLDACPF